VTLECKGGRAREVGPACASTPRLRASLRPIPGLSKLAPTVGWDQGGHPLSRRPGLQDSGGARPAPRPPERTVGAVGRKIAPPDRAGLMGIMRIIDRAQRTGLSRIPTPGSWPTCTSSGTPAERPGPRSGSSSPPPSSGRPPAARPPSMPAGATPSRARSPRWNLGQKLLTLGSPGHPRLHARHDHALPGERTTSS